MYDLRARGTLSDCKKAVVLLKRNEDDEDGNWLVYLVAAIALVRAVGHVLIKIDGQKEAKIGDFLKRNWPSWKQEDIYCHFIEEERNNVLKAYQFPAEPVFLATKSGKRLTSKSGAYFVSPRHMCMTSGFYKGRHIMDLFEDAISWWDSKLQQVESLL